MHTELDPRKGLQPKLPRVLNREVFYKGQTIIRQGSEGYRAFYIEKGRVEVRVRDREHSVKVSELGPGEIFGEMALIEHSDRSATIIALEDTTVTVISNQEMEAKINMIEDKSAVGLIHVLIERLCAANRGQVHHYRNLAEFQDRMAGMIEKASSGIDERRRGEFRKEVTPLLEQLDALLDAYTKVKN